MRRAPLVIAAAWLAVPACSSSGDGAPATSAPTAAVSAPAAAAQPGDTSGTTAATPESVPAASGVAATAAAPTDNRSCAALGADDLAEATGLPFQPGVASDIATAEFQDACDWRTADGLATAQLIIVSLDVYDQNLASAAAASPDGATDISVAGADAAYAAFNGAIVGMRVGDRFVQMAVLAAGTDQSQNVIALAELVLSRI